MAFSQRRRLHAALAEAQEAVLGRGTEGPAPPSAANIAYNYSCACATVEVAEWRHALKVRMLDCSKHKHSRHVVATRLREHLHFFKYPHDLRQHGTDFSISAFGPVADSDADHVTVRRWIEA